MRDVIFISIILLSLPVCVVRPFFGVLMWTWLSFMVPQRFCWGFAVNFPVAMMIGSATLAGFVLSGEKKRVPVSVGTFILALLWVWMSVSTLRAFNPTDAYPAWDMRSKMILMLFVMMALVHDRKRLLQVALVMTVCLGFLGAKGGLFTILTGGNYMVMGPNLSTMGGNNHIAVGFNMALPLLLFFARQMPSPRLVWAFRGAFGLTALAVVGTYSRGGMLGMAAVMLVMLMKNSQRLLLLVLLTVAMLGAAALVPQRWYQKMDTIRSYKEDESAQSRLNAWKLAWRLALARPLVGWGPEAMEDKSLYQVYYPDSPTIADVHSAYFQILSEGGLLTMAIWLSMSFWTVVTLQTLIRRYRGHPEHGWIAELGSAFQLSMLGYFVSAAFLEMGYFDFLFNTVALTISLKSIAAGLAPLPARVALPRPRFAPIPVGQMRVTPEGS